MNDTDRVEVVYYDGAWRVFFMCGELGKPFSTWADAWRYLDRAQRAYGKKYGVDLDWKIPNLPPKPKPQKSPKPKRSNPLKQNLVRKWVAEHRGQFRARDIQADTLVSRKTITHTLSQLRRDGLVDIRRNGKNTVYIKGEQ